VRRREFITLFWAAVAAWPLTTNAQQAATIFRVGFFGAISASSWASRVEAFRSGLRELGYVEGNNILIDFRWAEEKYDQQPGSAITGATSIKLN